MKTIENNYAFEKISSKMSKEFGKIEIGHEEEYAEFMFPIESNLIKISRKTGLNNSRYVLEALRISLFTIKGYLNGWEYDFDKYLTNENQGFVKAVLMAIDPFTNKELYKLLQEEYDLDSQDDLYDYFTIPIKCIVRVEDSVQYWTKNNGANGYFDFMGRHVKSALYDDFEMSFAFRKRSNIPQ